MSEPSKSELKAMVRIFLEEYNQLHKSSFAWDNVKSYNALSRLKPGVDAFAFQNNASIEIQHKTVIWDVENDQVRAKYAKWAVTALRKYLIADGLTQFTVHLNFDVDSIPTKPKEIEEFTFWVAHLIRSKEFDYYPKPPLLYLLPKHIWGQFLRWRARAYLIITGFRDVLRRSFDSNDIHQFVYSYEEDDETFLKQIRKFSSSIRILKDPDQKEPIVGFGNQKRGVRVLPHFGNVILEMALACVKKYSNEIILLDCQRPVDGIDMELLLDGLRPVKYAGEIWIVESFFTRKKATIVYPWNHKNLVIGN